MTGKVQELIDVLTPDLLATRITETWIRNDGMRQNWKQDVEEVRRYVYATDTRGTTNSINPWKNTTTIPKLCQIRDNLLANYMQVLFPKRKSIIWEADEEDANSRQKREAIVSYMSWVIEQPNFKQEMEKLVMDYIDFGNCFATVEWMDRRVQRKDGTQVGYVGPAVRRISPMDIVMNPTAEDFISSPKIVRSIVSMGELREILERMSNDDTRDTNEALWRYLKDIRFNARTFDGDWSERDHMYAMEGFTSFRDYLLSGTCEVLTFYGDWYDPYTDIFEKNKVITVVDRHKLIENKDNPSFFGYPPIYQAVWRARQDNLWGMGPLANLVGMQYRMDHVENMKADIWDLTTFPVIKIKGFVEDFKWGPGEKIFYSEEGDVDVIQPQVQIMQSNSETGMLQTLMEEMAGAPKEAMGIRSPGEKTKYEVQRLESASGRLFQSRITSFEEFFEMVLNAMLEMARRNLVGATSIRVFDSETKATTFNTLSVEDITGIGRIKPIAARHFAERAEMIQNLTALAGSGLWQKVQMHVGSVQLSELIIDAFDLKDYGLNTPFIALAEAAEAQRIQQKLEEQIHQETGTATGMGGDYDLNQPPGQSAQPPPQPVKPGFGLQRNPPMNATPTGTIGTQ